MTAHDTPAPDRYDRAKEILDAVNAAFPGHQLGWNSGRPWLALADAQDDGVKSSIRIGTLRSDNRRLTAEVADLTSELATTKQALIETVQAQQPAGRMRELHEENQRLTRELETAKRRYTTAFNGRDHAWNQLDRISKLLGEDGFEVDAVVGLVERYIDQVKLVTDRLTEMAAPAKQEGGAG